MNPFEMLREIPGPEFLVLFPVISAVCLFVAWRRATTDGVDKGILPEPDRYDSITLAYLRGGPNAVIRSAVFGLFDRNLVTIKKDGKDSVLQSTSGQRADNMVEKLLLDRLKLPRKAESLFSDEQLKYELAEHLKGVRALLEGSGLLRTDPERVNRQFVVAVGAGLAGLLGVTKLQMGLANNRPVEFLVFELLALLYVSYQLVKRISKTTPLGDRFLASVQDHFRWIEDAARKGRKGLEGIDPGLLVAIYGTSALMTNLDFSPFSEAFPVTKSQFGDGGSGCSGGCGGGGGGGGGCGGCGGGD